MIFQLFSQLDENVLVDLNVFKKRSKTQGFSTLIHSIKGIPFPEAIAKLHNILKPAVGAFQLNSNLPSFEIGKSFTLKEVFLYFEEEIFSVIFCENDSIEHTIFLGIFQGDYWLKNFNMKLNSFAALGAMLLESGFFKAEMTFSVSNGPVFGGAEVSVRIG